MSTQKATLYERLGGEEGITRFVGEFYERVLGDSSLAPYFKNVPIDKLQRMQRKFFAAAAGGPFVYSGRPLSQVHRHLHISKQEFARFTDHLIKTLEDQGVDEADIRSMIARIDLYADEITNDDPGVDG